MWSCHKFKTIFSTTTKPFSKYIAPINASQLSDIISTSKELNMAITHNVDILKLTVLNDGTDLVSEIDVEITSVDDSDPSNLTLTSYDRFVIDTSGGTSAAGFVSYGSLSEDVVKGWISAELAASRRIANAEKWIESKKNPPTPIKVSKTLPW